MSGLYVGYRAVPARQRAFLRLAVPALLWLMCMVAAAIGWTTTRSWGEGTWTTEVHTLEGVLTVDPYAVVHTDEGAVFLVDAGKVGVRGSIASLAGRRVSASGTLLERRGGRMLELLPGDDGVRAIGEAAAAPGGTMQGTIGLMGEIVDYKCYLGAMKPGRGVPHKSCAALCVRSGIPPVLVTDDDEHYVLTGAAGEAFNDVAAGYVGRRVALAGDLVIRADVKHVRVASVRVVR